MESPQGRVLSVHPETMPAHAVVEVAPAFRCERCAAGKGCGAGLFGSDQKSRRISALLPRGVDVEEGDDVRVELEPASVLQAVILVYALPGLGGLAGAGLAWALLLGDGLAALLAATGLAIGIAVGRMRLRRGVCLQRFTPTIRPHE